MIKKRIWFNNWFNTAYHIINLLKQNSEIEFEVFGTNKNQYSTVLKACDHFQIEENMPAEEYVEFCVEYCKLNAIDIFAPRSNMDIISQNAKRFSDIGVKLLLCCDWENLKLLSHKGEFYKVLKNNPAFNIPEYKIVNNVRDFEDGCKDIIGKGYRACFKPVLSEGGNGFRVIDQNAGSIDGLFQYVDSKITLEDAVKRLSQRESFRDLMVMEYIDGYEYSIDCLGFEGKLIRAVPRKKVNGRVRLLEESKELTMIAEEITRIFKLSYVYNIQIRMDKDKAKLLEVNPRMSGGIWLSCMSGINFPYLGVKLLIDQKIPENIPNPQFGILLSQIEKEVVL